LLFGASAALLSHFDPLKALQAIEKYKVRRFSAVPTMLTYLINHPDREKYDTSSLEKVHTGGAALPNEVRLEFERLFKCEVHEGYGLSETSPTACGYRDGEAYRVGSVGRAIPGVRVCIMDFANKPLGANQLGEICIQGPNVMKGYWKNEEATRDAVVDGWLHSGDIGYMDEDRYVYITDRKKDLIIKGGENISPREIEEAIYEHPSVSECAVVSVPCTTFGENICAVIVNKPGHAATEEEIKEHVSRYVTKFKVPAHVHFVPYMPKNPIGKILKKDIRKQMADWVAKQQAKEMEKVGK
ncbi:AMP-binding protein, partial [Candidatus Sumerlaeota bacterium]|nr:AMP-binding protein [Candidatus Sumerlaeota bacterium]